MSARMGLEAPDADMVRAAQDAMVPQGIRAPWLVRPRCDGTRDATAQAPPVLPDPVLPQDPAGRCACGCGELVLGDAMTGRPKRYVSHAHRMRAQRRRARAVR